MDVLQAIGTAVGQRAPQMTGEGGVLWDEAALARPRCAWCSTKHRGGALSSRSTSRDTQRPTYMSDPCGK